MPRYFQQNIIPTNFHCPIITVHVFPYVDDGIDDHFWGHLLCILYHEWQVLVFFLQVRNRLRLVRTKSYDRTFVLQPSYFKTVTCRPFKIPSIRKISETGISSFWCSPMTVDEERISWNITLFFDPNRASLFISSLDGSLSFPNW